MADEALPTRRPYVLGLIFFSAVLALTVLAHRYIGVRLFSDPAWGTRVETVGWFAVWGAFASIFAGFIGGRIFPKPLALVFQWVGYVWMGAFSLLLTGSAISDGALVLARQWVTPDASWARWQALFIAVSALLPLVWGAFVARRPLVRRVEIVVPGLPAPFEGLRIVQLTDVHIGETLRRGFTESLVAMVNALSPDVIAITGDLVEGSVQRLAHDVAPLADLRARLGKFYVTGNHEYYHDGPAWEREGARLGLTVLHNSHQVLNEGEASLVVAGVTDLQGGQFHEGHAPDLEKALNGAPVGAKRILLAHQPKFAKAAQGHDIALQLSGHTHGGQIFPFMFFVRLQQPVVAGLKRLWGVLVYTSKGTGYWGPPFRVGPRGEVTELTLRAA